ncbi:hypothetical protein [Planobispora rosea]|uniref:hypothetical protein n=1 Tax=Planobispora rosea TaxID=35762 RepID=UPI00083B75A7|nr:hypothetical protein [Planobispora rosea]
MPFKTFTDGAVLQADADVDRFFIQQVHALKTADESITSSTVLQNDDQLLVPLLANSQYWIELFAIYSAATASDLSITFSVPAGGALYWSHGGLAGGATGSVDRISRNFLDETGSGWIGGTGADAVVMGEGRVTTGATAGNLQLRWAQNASGATATIVKAGSILIAQRLTT